MSFKGPKPANAGERELFLEALSYGTAAERQRFLDGACAGNPELRLRVEELLATQAQLDGFLDAPAVVIRPAHAPDTVGAAAAEPPIEAPGDRIGRYRLLQTLGEGGCGIVYMAEQEEPVRRRVALKVIKLGMDTRSVIARFEAERQALAMMDHPNIARVLDAGATATGRPYFVMELVRGTRITEFCDEHKLSTKDRLTIFIQVTRAIQHAHQKGIIHRDIKPSNILVTLQDGVPVPKVIDFGIAKATEQRLTNLTVFTEFHSFIGTPAYMSPEQAGMTGIDVDTRSDIYSLGVLLYELLTGHPPFDPENLALSGIDECRRTIRETEPPWPSTRLSSVAAEELTTTATIRQTEPRHLISSLRGDLDWVVMKCLEKDRSRRYDTATALAIDLESYLANEPVAARPPSNSYRLRKLLARHRIAVGAAAVVAVALITAACVGTWLAIRARAAERLAAASTQREARLRQQAEEERERAQAERATARLNEYVADINLAHQSIVAGNYGRAIQLLDRHQPGTRDQDLRGFEWRYLSQLARGDEHMALPKVSGNVLSITFSPDGALVAAGSREVVVLMGVGTREILRTLQTPGSSILFTPDGKFLITAGRGSTRVWNTANWTEHTVMADVSGPLAISPDGAYLATSMRDGVRIWDARHWKPILALQDSLTPVAFAPDSKTVAAASRTSITLWDLSTGQSILETANSGIAYTRRSPRGPFFSDKTLAFSPNGRLLVALRGNPIAPGAFGLVSWDTATGEESLPFPTGPDRPTHNGTISAFGFSPDGSTLATASFDHSLRLWDVATRNLRTTLHAHLNEVWTVAYSPDGQLIATGAKDGGVLLWPARPRNNADLIAGDWIPLAFDRDGRTLAAFQPNGRVALFNTRTLDPETQWTVEIPRNPFAASIAFDGDLRTMAHAGTNGRVVITDVQTRESSQFETGDDRVDFVGLSPDGRRVMTSGFRQLYKVWELGRTREPLLALDANRCFFAADGRTAVAVMRSRTIQVWNLDPPTLRRTIQAEGGQGGAAALSADGRYLGVGTSPDDADHAVHIYDLEAGVHVGSLNGHKQGLSSVSFSYDGRTIATSSTDGTTKLWNSATRQELLSIGAGGGALKQLVFSPNGMHLAGTTGSFGSSAGLRLLTAPALLRPPGEVQR